MTHLTTPATAPPAELDALYYQDILQKLQKIHAKGYGLLWFGDETDWDDLILCDFTPAGKIAQQILSLHAKMKLEGFIFKEFRFSFLLFDVLIILIKRP